METKKTKLTISGKPRKNLYDNQGLKNNKKKNKSLLLRKSFLNHLIKTIQDLQDFQKNLSQESHLSHRKQENHLFLQK